MSHRKLAKVGMGLQLFALLFSLSCSGKVSIEMDDKLPPTFRFQRNNDHVYFIPVFSVCEVDPANLNVAWSQREKDNRIIWQIEPPTGPEREIENLRPITYGTTPEGFTQIIPESGPPPPLIEGKTYEAGGPGVMVPHGVLRFTIRGGKAIKLRIPGSTEGNSKGEAPKPK